jgi:NADH dehydrogenase
MILLTGATGLIGSALLRRLVAREDTVRCLVRDPRRLRAQRVRVQIALGDLADADSFRHALRGVHTVVHLAASTRDQERGTIEELNGIASWRLVRAAERAGVQRFVFFSSLGAGFDSPSRFLRAKALAERAVERTSLPHDVFAPSLVYSPGDRWLTLLEHMSLLPVLPTPGEGQARFQPIWADDVADCVVAALEREPGGRYELAGPEALPYETILRLALRSFNRSRRLWRVPLPLVRALLEPAERMAGRATPATWDEVELLQDSLLSQRRTADAERLGVRPQPMGIVLGLAEELPGLSAVRG